MPVSVTLTSIGQPGRLVIFARFGLLCRQGGGILFPGAAALQVREVQVRAGVALRELTAERPASGPAAAARRDAGVVLILAGPAVDAFRTIPVIEPGRVQGTPPVT